MGTIKDLVDLTTQLANSVQDRKIAKELNDIQSLILSLQSEQAGLHESNIQLREERLTLKEHILKLETEIQHLRKARPQGPVGVPTCPNCSTESKPVYMSSIPSPNVKITGLTHRCNTCQYSMKVESSAGNS